MAFSPLLCLTLVSLLLVGFAATGVRALRQFSHHRLETLCRRRNQLELFGTIVAQHDQLALGAESMRVVANVCYVFLGTCWLLRDTGRVADALPYFPPLGLGAGVLLAVVATMWIPNAVVQIWPAAFLLRTWKLWKVIGWLMTPVSSGVLFVDALLRRLADRPRSNDEEEEALEEEIRSIVTAGLQGGLMDEDAREMIEGVMELDDVDVADIMTPRSEMCALDSQATWQETLDFVVESGHTRIPVYQRSLDHVVGVLYAKDMLGELAKSNEHERVPIAEMLRDALYVPKSKAVDALLQEFRKERTHLAIVVDEFEVTAGVVTIEDAIEEIVGEIADEYDGDEEAGFYRVSDNCIEAIGRAHLNELNEHFGLDLPAPEDFDTVGGWVVEQLGRIPAAGTVVDSDTMCITVLEADKKRVLRVRIQTKERRTKAV